LNIKYFELISYLNIDYFELIFFSPNFKDDFSNDMIAPLTFLNKLYVFNFSGIE